MFAIKGQEQVRRRLLEVAAADPAITGAAVVGSHAHGLDDGWSDVDLVLGVEGPLEGALDRWTSLIQREFSAVHHWDLPAGSAIYRVFLLPQGTGWLEVDIGFMPSADFGPRGPHWRTVFGRAADRPAHIAPAVDFLAGQAWHHAMHARICVERGRLWQAAHWIGALRDQTIALACLRLGHPTAYAKGAHLLPESVTATLEPTLVGSLDRAELLRALAAAVAALATELANTDQDLAARLSPMLISLAG